LLCTPLAGVTLDGPAHVEKGLNTTTYRTQTDAMGRFSLPAAEVPQGLIVVHEQGYAEIPMNLRPSDLASRLFNTGSPVSSDTDGSTEVAADGQDNAPASQRELTVKLQPWGRIEGTVMLESKPAANEIVKVGGHVARYSKEGRRFTFMTFHLEARTDAAGSFSFDKVPAGQCNVFRQQLRSHTGFESHETAVRVKPGEVTHVDLGGSGPSIFGKAFLPEASIDWQSVPVHLRLKTGIESGPRPQRADFTSRDAYITAMEQFFAVNKAQQRFGAFCERDGSFRLSDIPPGTYELVIKVRDSGATSVSDNEPLRPGREIGSIAREIVVPELSDGQSGEALDLGTLALAKPEREF